MPKAGSKGKIFDREAAKTAKKIPSDGGVADLSAVALAKEESRGGFST
jgi:hypothetical protein